MQITERKIEELIPYERNAKTHGERQIQELTKSIQRYGFRSPVLIDKDGTIIAGHGRVEAAKRAGLSEVPCVCYDDMTPEEVREYRIADNRLAEMDSGWDLTVLDLELNKLDFGELDLGLDFHSLTNGLMANGEEDEGYAGFVDKFKPKHTTDDCITPPEVYEAIRGWAVSEYGWEGRPVVRPFYPGGDYERFAYPENCVVIDNPPFSILSEIVRRYEKRHISYFLFAPTKTLFGIAAGGAHYVVTRCDIVYENGAKVNTGFVCSEGAKIKVAGSLTELVKKAQRTKDNSFEEYDYPVSVVTAARLAKYANSWLDYEFDECEFVRELDSQKAEGKTLYGGGFFVPEKAVEEAAEKAAKKAAKKAAEKAAEKAVKWELSAREQAIVDRLNAQYEARQVSRYGGRKKENG